MHGIEYSGILTLDMLLIMKKRKVSTYVRDLQKMHQGLREICHQVNRSGFLKSYISCFYTTASTRAARDHWDNHDLIALQIAGRKEWYVKASPDVEAVIHDPTFVTPQDYKITDAEPYVTEPGDALYIPRGCGHYAKTLGEDSLHLVLSLHPIHLKDLLENWIAAHIKDNPVLRTSIFDGSGNGNLEIADTVISNLSDQLTVDALRDHAKTMIAERSRTATFLDFGQAFVKDVDTLIKS